MLKGLVAVGLSVLMVCLPAAWAATPVALGHVTATGAAQINGQAIRSDMTVFAGDHLATQEQTLASLSFSGSNRILVPGSTAVTIGERDGRVVVELEHGALAVLARSAKPVAVEAMGAQILPVSNAPAVMEVAIQDNILKVVMRRGSAELKAANKTIEVKEGNELDATIAPSPTPQTGGQSAFVTHEALFAMIALGAGLTGLGLGVYAITNDKANPADCVANSVTGKIVCP
ncbi:MAG: hypothetical protein ACRD50_10305 [Candidatus Acidiferrales bacterium]